MSKDLAALSSIDLEDSYFLGIVVSGTTLRVRGLFALTGDHEAYASPRPGEQHCYREGEVTLTNVAISKWTSRKSSVSSDPDGSLDFGSIAIRQSEHGYHISTDWFDMVCHSEFLTLALD